MPRFLRFLGVVLFFTAIFIPKDLLAQCNGLPTVQTLGSNKVPDGFCSPVSATINYNVGFLSAVPTGTLELVIDWGDGGAQTIVAQTANSTNKSFTVSQAHSFPVNSDCEFLVVMTMRYNGTLCLNTRQQQKIASWRTDEFNGGNVQLISPVTGNNEHLVCYGQDVNVIFEDETEFNCAADYTHLGTVIETPNTEVRWQQIVYNTATGGSKIPNASVNGVPVTGAAGVDVRFQYQDPRGVLRMAPPVVMNDARRRNTLPITAQGGFGPTFPQVGDILEVTIKYWNFCNPYSEGPNPMVPLNGDLINGDNPPVLRTARIRIVDSPPAPSGGDQTVCNGVTPTAFSIGGVPANNVVNWYRDNAGAPGTLITQTPGTTLPINQHPNWVNNTTAGVYRVWASYQPNVVGAMNCESPRILVTRTIREAIAVPDPVPALPTEICNGTSATPVNLTISLPGPVTMPIGGATSYTIAGGAGLTVTSSTANSATFSVNVGFTPGTLSVSRNITVTRRYTTAPDCPVIRTFPITIYNRPVGGTPTPIPDVCQTTPLSTIVLNGYLGTIVRWEESFNGGAWNPYTGPSSGASISPGTRAPGVYRFRAVVNNGTCTAVFSSEISVTVSSTPVATVTTGPDQFWCGQLFSTGMGGTPTGGVGTGTWTYVSSFPAGRPAPTISNINDPNATITIANATLAGAYTMRWTIENGNCSASDDIIIDFGSTPTPSNAGPAQDVCGESTQLAGNAPSIGFGSWTILSNPSGAGDPGNTVVVIVDPTSPTSDINLVGPTFRYGTYVLQWQIKSGACPVSVSTVNITFAQPATATAPDIGPVCIGPSTFTAIPLTGTIGGGATGGQWVNVDGTGTLSASTVSGATVTASYTPSAADYAAGTPIHIKLVANVGAPCVNAEHEITITIDRTPLANAGTNITNICGDNVQLNAENPPPYGATGVWTTSVAGVTFDDPTDPQTFVRGLPATPLPNTTPVTWTLTSASGLCPAMPATINLTRVSPPVASNQVFTECEILPAGAPVVTNIVLANYQATILTASGGTSIIWYRNSSPETGGTIIPNANTVQTNIADGQIYIARVAGGSGCTSDVRVTIRVRALPPAITKDVALCEDGIGTNTASGIDLNTPTYINDVTGGATGVTVAWYDNQADASAATNPITAPFNVTGSRIVYGRVTYSSSPACWDIGQITLTVKNLPNNAEIFGREFVCKGNAADPNDLPSELYQVTPITGAKYFWDIPTDPTTGVRLFLGGTTDDSFVLLQFPNITTVTIKVHVEINGCAGPVIEKVINVSQIPPKPSIVGEKVVCENDNGIPYTLSISNYPASSYNWEIRKASDNSLGGAFVSDGQATDHILVNFFEENVILSVRESNSICVSDTVNLPIKINKRPEIANTDVDVCSDSPSGLVFIATPASPVPIDKFNITSAIVTTGLTPVVGATTGTGLAANAIQNDTYENLTAVFLPVNYTVQPISVGPTGKECPGASEIITLNIKPEPQLDPNLSRSICSGDETNIILVSATNTFPADRFIIEAITQQNPGSLTPLSAIQTPDPTTLYLADAIRSHRWENTTGVNQRVSYAIRPYSTIIGCSGNPPTTVDVTIYPKTVVDPIDTIRVCSGSQLVVSFTSAINSDPDYIWSVRSFDPTVKISGGPTTGVGPIGGLTVENTSLTVDGKILFEVQGKNSAVEGECLGPVMQFWVKVLKSPKAISLDLEACSDAVGQTTATVNLQILETSVVGQDPIPADIRITWFRDNGLGSQILPADLTAYVIQNNIPVYARVEYIPTGCINVATVRFKVNPTVGLTVTPTNVNCAGANNGEIKVDVTGGTPSFQYSMDGGGIIILPVNTYTFTLIPGGTTHTILVTDSKGCTATANNITVTSPPALGHNSNQKDVTCFLGADGEIRMNVFGGTTDASGNYKEFRILQTGLVDPDNDGVFTGLSFGSYTVRVTDFNDCTLDVQFNLTQPTQVELVNVNVVADANNYNLSCRNATDGSIQVTVSGGTPDQSTGFDRYHYVLTNANNPSFNIDTLASPSEVFDKRYSRAITWGTYTIQAFDQRNCPSRAAIAVVLNPPPFDAGVIGTSYTMCNGGTPQTIVQLAPASGGVGNYRYEWERESDLALGYTPLGKDSTQHTPSSSEVATPTTYRYHRVVRTISTLAIAEQCPALTTKDVIITVNKTLKAGIDKTGTECEGTSGSVIITLNGLPPNQNNVFVASYKNNTETVNNYRGIQFNGDDFGRATIPITSFTNNDTYTLLSVTDPFGCPADIDPDHVDIVVKKTPVLLHRVDPQCSDTPVVLTYDFDNTLTYRLDFGDNTPIITYPPGTAPGTASHLYRGDTGGAKSYMAVLYAQNDVCPETSSKQEVALHQALELDLKKGDATICGGGTTTFRDDSRGVDNSRWYYRPVGSTDVLEEKPGPQTDVTYTLNNNTTLNPIVYEFVYEASNTDGCIGGATFPVTVYRNVVANFDIGPVPPFQAGVAQVDFTNLSTPANAGPDIAYAWDFGDLRADPPAANAWGPDFTVKYPSAGSKDIRLKVSNLAALVANAKGNTCESIITKNIMIELPDIAAAFMATPLASCLPTLITVTNMSPGADTFEWKLYNQGTLVSTSNLANPVFNIQNAGKYRIELKATYAPTGQFKLATRELDVFPIPVAGFDFRPNPVYVPDTELSAYNMSKNADHFTWDFDDGYVTNDENPTHIYKLEGQYIITLVASRAYGTFDVDGDGTLDKEIICYDTTRQIVNAIHGGQIKIPNAFTPSPGGSTGGTGIPGNGSFNDVFLPISAGVEEFDMQIFDRWGNELFESKDKNVGWDGYDKNGRLMPAGVYVYRLVMRLSNGQRTTKVGDVTLIR